MDIPEKSYKFINQIEIPGSKEFVEGVLAQFEVENLEEFFTEEKNLRKNVFVINENTDLKIINLVKNYLTNFIIQSDSSFTFSIKNKHYSVSFNHNFELDKISFKTNVHMPNTNDIIHCHLAHDPDNGLFSKWFEVPMYTLSFYYEDVHSSQLPFTFRKKLKSFNPNTGIKNLNKENFLKTSSPDFPIDNKSYHTKYFSCIKGSYDLEQNKITSLGDDSSFDYSLENENKDFPLIQPSLNMINALKENDLFSFVVPKLER